MTPYLLQYGAVRYGFVPGQDRRFHAHERVDSGLKGLLIGRDPLHEDVHFLGYTKSPTLSLNEIHRAIHRDEEVDNGEPADRQGGTRASALPSRNINFFCLLLLSPLRLQCRKDFY